MKKSTEKPNWKEATDNFLGVGWSKIHESATERKKETGSINIKGLTRVTGNRIQASFFENNKNTFLGVFDAVEEAEQAVAIYKKTKNKEAVGYIKRRRIGLSGIPCVVARENTAGERRWRAEQVRNGKRRVSAVFEKVEDAEKALKTLWE